MQVHRLITFTAGAVFHEARTTAFNLYTASSLLLDMFHIRPTMSNDLCSKIKAWDWFEVNWNPFLRPFALNTVRPVSSITKTSKECQAYTAKFIPLHLVWFSPPESPLIDKIGQFLLHEFLDLLDSLFKAFLCSASDMKVQGRALM
jgi:hypothetical protein